jgi:hypothetical protein
MKVKLEKWYLDFTSEDVTGFYYIMRLSFGRFKFGFSGINHFDPTQAVQNFKFSRIKRLSFHKLQLSKAELSSSISAAQLHIDHGKTEIQGTWKFLSPPLKRLRKPLFKNELGWADWKVWTPMAEVDLSFRNGKNSTSLKGTGYIDFVRMTIPFWKMPFQSLYWGRMHSPASWSVFLSLQSEGEKISLYLDPQTGAQEASVSLKRNEMGDAQSMAWTIDSKDKPINFEGNVTRVLESQDVLEKGRTLRLLPRGIRRMLSSSGRDEKYQMISRFRDQIYHGIMEEVTYHE